MDTELIKEMKARLRRIAAKNDDEWRVTVTLDERGQHIEVIETADRHILTEGHGPTVAAAIENLYTNLPAALESWGYDNAE